MRLFCFPLFAILNVGIFFSIPLFHFHLIAMMFTEKRKEKQATGKIQMEIK